VNPIAKLAGFAAVLALVFAGAAFAGSRLDVHPGRPAADAKPAHMGGMAATSTAVRGLAVSDHGLTLQLARHTAQPGRRFELAFRITDRRGRTVRDFDVEHTKRMHFIVVRRDMTGFQHLHPTQRPDGSWSVPVTLPDAGSYRVFADFSHDGETTTLASDLRVDGDAEFVPLPEPATEATTGDGYSVRLAETQAHAGRESAIRFTVLQHDKPVKVQPYLGANGHLVALREGDLAFLHVHPMEGTTEFDSTFPTVGRYRLFLQFKHAGRVHTVAFTQEVI
jgi:hypothetical protein